MVNWVCRNAFAEMRRRRRCAIATMIALGLAGCSGHPDPKANVILISIDTLRADHLGCYGYDRDTSPFFDALAETGVLFEHAIAQAPGTLPSHMSIFTGLFPREHDVFPPDDVLSTEIRTLPEILRDAGFRTGGFTEGGYVAGRFGFSRGFQQFDDSVRKINTDIEDVFQRGVDFLHTINDGERFFLFLHTYATHDPYYPPPPYCGHYLPEADTDQVNEFEPFGENELQGITPESQDLQVQKHKAAISFIRQNLPDGSPMPTGPELEGFNREGRLASERTIAFYESLYDGTINYVDDVLKVFFARIEESGLAETTVVIITSDHGEEFFEHGRFTHEQVYHESLHIPLLVVGPSIASDRRIPDLVMTVDLMPTILELLNLPLPAHVSGRSITPMLSESSGQVEPRDAHALGIMDPGEALYRMIEDEPRQLVVHDPPANEEGRWVQRDITLESLEPTLRFTAMSYHQTRSVGITIDGDTASSITLTPQWKTFDLDLPADGRRHLTTLSSLTCDSPANLGLGSDSRCLAFRIRDYPTRHTQLFNIKRDPAEATNLASEEPEILRQLLDGLGAFDRDPVAHSAAVPLDDETEQRLRELGYLQ